MVIHLIAIGGTGMAPLACLLSGLGHQVRGSDGPLYPPMSDLLRDAGISPLAGYAPAHLLPAPDLVVVGNAVPRSNPEVVEMERLGLPRLSMPEALARFCLVDRRPLVVAGTHGKTTTTAMATWVWTELGLDPGYLIGGAPRGLPASHHLGTGPRFIVEGDEYNAAYFDRGPKFLHYRPHTVILTSAEYDHADLYPDPASHTEAFRRLLDLVPDDGCLVACGDRAEVASLAAEARCPVVSYGLARENDVRPTDPGVWTTEGWTGTVEAPGGTVPLSLPAPGAHNLTNALGVLAAADVEGLPLADVAAALSRFPGVHRRLEELGSAAGVTVVDDFAHHPTAVGASLGALRDRFPDRRLFAVYEPRSLTAGRAFLAEAYLDAFGRADLVVIAPAVHRNRLTPDERLDFGALAATLRSRGVATRALDGHEPVLGVVLGLVRPGDIVVTMSSGAFDRLPYEILRALSAPPLAPPDQLGPVAGDGGTSSC